MLIISNFFAIRKRGKNKKVSKKSAAGKMQLEKLEKNQGNFKFFKLTFSFLISRGRSVTALFKQPVKKAAAMRAKAV